MDKLELSCNFSRLFEFLTCDENQPIKVFQVWQVEVHWPSIFLSLFSWNSTWRDIISWLWQTCSLLKVKLLLEIKVFKRGRGDEYLALSTEPKSRWFHGSTNMDILPITILFFFCSRLLREWENDLFPSLQTHIVKESAVFWNRNIIYL